MDHRHSNHARRTLTRGGFSLIELLAVIAIAAVLAAAAIPAMNRTTDARSAAAAAVIVRDLTQARERAVATGVRTWITFDLAAQAYTVAAENPLVPGRADAISLMEPGVGRPLRRAFDAGEFVAVRVLTADFDGAAALGFDWRGGPLAESELPLAARGVVTLTGNHSVTVEPGTGLVAMVAP